MAWIRVEDGLPENNQYVLVIYNGDNWHDKDDMERVKCVVAKFKKGISLKDRELLSDGERKRLYTIADEGFNNEKPYCWQTFGALCLFGQDVSHWQSIKMPEK